MIHSKKLILFFILFFTFLFNFQKIFADDIMETLILIQQDLKTLERAVYSENETSENLNLENNYSEDALTRHLLKLSEIEKQFQNLTHRFEEINFKIDKLSNRMSKIQFDNQLRFQDIESSLLSGVVSQKLSSRPKEQLEKIKIRKIVQTLFFVISQYLLLPSKNFTP